MRTERRDFAPERETGVHGRLKVTSLDLGDRSLPSRMIVMMTNEARDWDWADGSSLHPQLDEQGRTEHNGNKCRCDHGQCRLGFLHAHTIFYISKLSIKICVIFFLRIFIAIEGWFCRLFLHIVNDEWCLDGFGSFTTMFMISTNNSPETPTSEGKNTSYRKKLKPQKPSGWKHSLFVHWSNIVAENPSPYLDWVFQSNNGIDIWSAENMYCTPNSIAMIPSLQGIVVVYFEGKKRNKSFLSILWSKLNAWFLRLCTVQYWLYVQGNTFRRRYL